MKKIFALILIVLSFGCQKLQEKNQNEEFAFLTKDIKSGVIEYSMKGFITGTEIRYFKDYNKKSAVYSTIYDQNKTILKKIYANQKGVTTLTTVNGKEYQKYLPINLFNSQYIKMEKMLRKTGESVILGKKCNVYTIQANSSKVVIHRWNKLPLKTEVYNHRGTMIMEATKIELKDIPDSKISLK